MEERKYSVVGTVSIGTDEYRDLIEDVQKARNDVDRYLRQGWDKDSRISELQKELEKIKAENKKLKEFVNKKVCLDEAEDAKDFIAIFFNGD